MCYAKPGPRCASHLTTDIQKLETEVKDLESTPGDASKFKLIQVRSRLDAYRFAFDGTQTGQTQLQAALDSMQLDDPDYKDIKKYKENARKEYDLKIRNFKEVEKIRAERDTKKKDLLARKARLEAELAELDSSVDDLDDPDMDDSAASASSAPTGGTSAHSYGSKGGYSTGKGGSISSASYRNPRSSSSRAASLPIRSTTSHAYSGKGFGGK